MWHSRHKWLIPYLSALLALLKQENLIKLSEFPFAYLFEWFCFLDFVVCYLRSDHCLPRKEMGLGLQSIAQVISALNLEAKTHSPKE